jgi:hypothetical protein
MRDILDQFKEPGTRDELGLAGVRDAFSDLLFPGTGSLQKRARYFFFVPWMYLEFERRRTPASEITRRDRKFELDLIDVLVENGQPRVIGKVARRNLQRLPSNIYWSGLRRLGLLLFTGSQEQFHRRFDRLVARGRPARNDDGESIEGTTRSWHPGLPDSAPGFPEAVSFDLTPAEAEFLVDRIRIAAPRSFFPWWIDRQCPGNGTQFAWEAVGERELPTHLRREIGHARRFSVVMHGATMLYTYLPTRLRGDDERAELLLDDFDAWFARTSALADELAGRTSRMGPTRLLAMRGGGGRADWRPYPRLRRIVARVRAGCEDGQGTPGQHTRAGAARTARVVPEEGTGPIPQQARPRTLGRVIGPSATGLPLVERPRHWPRHRDGFGLVSA